MIVTMLEGVVPESAADGLTDAFAHSTDHLPPQIQEAFLLRAGDVWRIVAQWRSAEDLAAYQASVPTPGGVLMFRSVGVEPSLAVFEVVGHAATHPEVV